MPLDPVSHQLPSSLVAPEFGEVNVRRTASGTEVQFTILMEPQGVEAEGWQTGVALDGSASMRHWYGQVLLGEVPPHLLTDYRRRGWITEAVEDGHQVQIYQQMAFDDAIRRGHLRFSENIVQAPAREFIAYLAGNLDADGGTTVIYWACGSGAAYEVLGDFTTEQCRALELRGPREVPFGVGTCLVPAVRYFVDRFRDAERGMYVFLTDGRLDDLREVKAYTTQLAREIEAGRRHMVKCVLIGVGDQIDESQMEQLDDLDTGTKIDIWDHKILREMRDLKEIFAEVVDENQIVAPTARLLDARGQTVKDFSDGLPAKVEFTLPAESAWFELEVGDARIRQTLGTR